MGRQDGTGTGRSQACGTLPRAAGPGSKNAFRQSGRWDWPGLGLIRQLRKGRKEFRIRENVIDFTSSSTVTVS